MADIATAQRKPALSGLKGGNGAVRITPCLPASRIVLRAHSSDLPGLSQALGLQVPTRPKTSATHGERMALWLGPDEWLVIDQSGVDLMSLCAGSGVVHAATDVSHRNIGIMVSGPGAADTINAACPLDLSLTGFPVGAAARTIFGKIEIVLHRVDADTFRVECWRSFADYAFGMLSEGAEDASV